MRCPTPLALSLAALATACASTPPHPALRPGPEGSATVVLVRDDSGPREEAPVRLLLDDAPIASLVGGHWTRLWLEPGAHRFAVAALDDPERRANFQTSWPGFVRETSGVGPADTAEVELGADETRYLLVRHERTDTTREREGQGHVVDTRFLFAVEPLEEAAARERMDRYREVSVPHP